MGFMGCTQDAPESSEQDAETAASQSTSDVAKADSATATAGLVGPEWRLTRFGMENPVEDTLQRVKVTAVFSEERRVSGISGCNRYSGEYDARRDSLMFGKMASTKRACPDPVMKVEERYLDVLGDIRSYEIRDERLDLYDEGGALRLTFRRGGGDVDGRQGASSAADSTVQATSGRVRSFKALGQEPGWLAVITPDTIRYEGNYGETMITFPTPQPAIADTGSVVYDTTARGHSLQLVIDETDCTDAMSGKPFPSTVTITVDGETYRGCGAPGDEDADGSES